MLFFLWSSMIYALCLKNIKTELAFVPVLDSNSLFEVSMNTLCLFVNRFHTSFTTTPPEYY